MTHGPGRGAVEVELKLAASDGRPLRLLRRRRRLGPARLGPAVSFDELDRYLDTADRALAAARWACRLRVRQGKAILSLKGPRLGVVAGAHSLSSLHERPEVEGPAGHDRPTGGGVDVGALPPSAARDLLAKLAGDRRLLERFALAQRRTEREVLVGGRLVGLLSLDRVDVIDHGRRMGRLWAVELELARDHEPGSSADIGRDLVPLLADALGSVPGLRPDDRTKLEHALERLGAPGSPRRQSG